MSSNLSRPNPLRDCRYVEQTMRANNYKTALVTSTCHISTRGEVREVWTRLNRTEQEYCPKQLTIHMSSGFERYSRIDIPTIGSFTCTYRISLEFVLIFNVHIYTGFYTKHGFRVGVIEPSEMVSRIQVASISTIPGESRLIDNCVTQSVSWFVAWSCIYYFKLSAYRNKCILSTYQYTVLPWTYLLQWLLLWAL